MKNRFRRSIAMLLMLAMLSGLIGPGNLMLLTAYAEGENVETLDIPDIAEDPEVPEIVETPVEQGEIEIPPVDAGGDAIPPAEEQGGELPGQGAGELPVPGTEGETGQENTVETGLVENVGGEPDGNGAQPVTLTEGEFWIHPLDAEDKEIETVLLHLTGLFPEDAQVLAYAQDFTVVENAVEACRVVILSEGQLWQPAANPITVQIYSAAVSAILAEGLQPAVWEVRYPVEPVTEPLCLPYGEQAWVDEDGALCFEAWYFEVLEIAAVAAPAAEPTEELADGLVPETNVTTDPVDDNTGEPVEKPEEKPEEKPVENPIENPEENPEEKPVENPVDNPVENPAEEPAGEIGGDSEDDGKELDETLTPDLNIRAMPLSGKLESTVSGVAATLTSAIGSTIAFNFEEQGRYVFISVTGTCQRNQEPVVRAASVNGDETRRVLEAWTVDNLKKKASLTLTTEVTALPELSEGECLAVCAVTGDTLGETLRSDLSVGDTVELPLAMKGPTGIAVVIAPAAPEDPDDETLIPDNAIWANDALYLTGKMPKNAVVVAEPVSVEIEGQDVLAAWDIKIYANENQRQKGKTWQPAGDSVQVHMRSDAFQGAADNLNVYHLTDAKSAAELVTTVMAESTWVAFDAASFSTYAVSTVLEKTITATDGNTYKITVTYDSASGFPNGAELEVSEITDPDAYRVYLDNAAATLGVSLESLTYTRLFDITVMGPDGRSYQPNDAVSVEVELMESEARTVDDMRVVHFGSGAEELDAETANGTVTFETAGFSVFSFLDTSVIDRVVGAIFGTDSKLYENDDIILTGRMPLLGTVEARPVTVELEGKNVLLAYDIKIYANSLMKLLGIAWQPSEGAITVQVKSDVLTDGSKLTVYHMADINSPVEVVGEGIEVQDHSITFPAESFSIYPIGEEQENARIGYRFWYNDGTQNILLSTQYFRYKDVHPAGGGSGLQLNEPSLPGVDNTTWNRIFKGWSKTGFEDDDANLTNIDALNTELSAKAEADYVEGTFVDLFANLKNVYYVTYVDVNPNNVLATEIIPRAESGVTTFTIKAADELRPTIDSDTQLQGWYEIDNLDTVYTPGQTGVVISGNMTLYPKIEGGYWLIFNDNDLVDDGHGHMVSGGASFTPPAFYLNEITNAPVEPTWTGYAFGGWYADSACTTPFEFGSLLNHDTTVYAKWTPSASSYRVIIWKQRTSDKPTTPDAEKTYDYIYSDLFDQNVVTGQTVTLNNRYTRIYGTNGTSTDTDKAYFVYNAGKTDQSVVVKADGSTVLNVYYDRKPVTLNYYIYGYAPATINGDSDYGRIDGQYVRLFRNGEKYYYLVNGSTPYTNDYIVDKSGNNYYWDYTSNASY